MPRRAEIRFTDAYVKSLKPAQNRYDVYDAALAGFGMRVSTSGTKSWVVLSRTLNRKTRATLGRYPQMSLAEARHRALSALQSMADGEYSSSSSLEAFEHALDEWYLRDQASNKSFAQVKSAMELHVRPELKNFKLKDIKKRDLIKIVDGIGSTAPTQANRVLAFTKRFFNWCVSRDLLDFSPAQGVAKYAQEVSRDRVLTPDEIKLIMQGARMMPYPFGPLLRILALTGQRLNEVAAMSWSELDLEAAKWIIPKERAKNKTSHIVHLSEPSLKELIALKSIALNELVFTTTGKTPVSGFSRAKKIIDQHSGVQDWRLHDLRRTFATVTTETLGYQPAVVDRVLNHVSGSVRGVAAVYQRGQYLQERRLVLDAWADYVTRLQGD